MGDSCPASGQVARERLQSNTKNVYTGQDAYTNPLLDLGQQISSQYNQQRAQNNAMYGGVGYQGSFMNPGPAAAPPGGWAGEGAGAGGGTGGAGGSGGGGNTGAGGTDNKDVQLPNAPGPGSKVPEGGVGPPNTGGGGGYNGIGGSGGPTQVGTNPGGGAGGPSSYVPRVGDTPTYPTGNGPNDPNAPPPGYNYQAGPSGGAPSDYWVNSQTGKDWGQEHPGQTYSPPGGGGYQSPPIGGPVGPPPGAQYQNPNAPIEQGQGTGADPNAPPPGYTYQAGPSGGAPSDYWVNQQTGKDWGQEHPGQTYSGQVSGTLPPGGGGGGYGGPGVGGPVGPPGGGAQPSMAGGTSSASTAPAGGSYVKQQAPPGYSNSFVENGQSYIYMNPQTGHSYSDENGGRAANPSGPPPPLPSQGQSGAPGGATPPASDGGAQSVAPLGPIGDPPQEGPVQPGSGPATSSNSFVPNRDDLQRWTEGLAKDGDPNNVLERQQFQAQRNQWYQQHPDQLNADYTGLYNPSPLLTGVPRTQPSSPIRQQGNDYNDPFSAAVNPTAPTGGIVGGWDQYGQQSGDEASIQSAYVDRALDPRGGANSQDWVNGAGWQSLAASGDTPEEGAVRAQYGAIAGNPMTSEDANLQAQFNAVGGDGLNGDARNVSNAVTAWGGGQGGAGEAAALGNYNAMAGSTGYSPEEQNAFSQQALDAARSRTAALKSQMINAQKRTGNTAGFYGAMAGADLGQTQAMAKSAQDITIANAQEAARRREVGNTGLLASGNLEQQRQNAAFSQSSNLLNPAQDRALSALNSARGQSNDLFGRQTTALAGQQAMNQAEQQRRLAALGGQATYNDTTYNRANTALGNINQLQQQQRGYQNSALNAQTGLYNSGLARQDALTNQLLGIYKTPAETNTELGQTTGGGGI